MTKLDFLNGESFRLKGVCEYKGAETFKEAGGMILSESRSSYDEKVLFVSHHTNISKVTKTKVYAFTFILGKKINRVIKFEDMIKYENIYETSQI
mgnify:CR=1 FL=1